MGDLVGVRTILPDVLASCIRHSSMDADIETDPICTNDFASFFPQHPRITRVFFNGAMTGQPLLGHVQDLLGHGSRTANASGTELNDLRPEAYWVSASKAPIKP